MKRFLFTVGMTAFLIGCVAENKSQDVPLANWKSEVEVVPSENVITQPDEERLALQSFKEVPPARNESGSYMDWLAKGLRKDLRSTGAQVKEVGGQIGCQAGVLHSHLNTDGALFGSVEFE